MISLGSTVQCQVTGLIGIAMSYNVHKNGCVRVSIQPKIDKEGKVPDDIWADAIDLVEKVAVGVTNPMFLIPTTGEVEPSPGGPGRSTPPPLSTPR
ncbi:MAG TPA: hypothetical protein ENI23_07005 [bacterium]|nr:hypothetical protein [bacterium]